MKKLFASILVLICACFFFAGCQGNSSSTPSGSTTTPPEQSAGSDDNDKKETDKMYITINGNKLAVTLEKNSSVDALVEILKKGDITYTADDYGGFEKVGYIGHNLPTNDTEITTQAGDVILYQGNNICLYYDENTWDFTLLGRINGYSASELRTLLGAGNGSVQVVISLS